MKRAIQAFGDKLEEAGPEGVGLFYFAGHGIQVKGENYLIPVASQIRDESDMDIEAVTADAVLQQMEYAGNGINIMILDACRNNPFDRSTRSTTRGLARMDAPTGSVIAYATSPGKTASDGTGRNSPYTAALARALRKPGTKIEEVFKRVRIEVMDRTENEQIPWESSSLIGDFFFVEKEPEPVIDYAAIKRAEEAKAAAEEINREAEFWGRVTNASEPEAFDAYLKQFPDGRFRILAKIKRDQLIAAGG